MDQLLHWQSATRQRLSLSLLDVALISCLHQAAYPLHGTKPVGRQTRHQILQAGDEARRVVERTTDIDEACRTAVTALRRYIAILMPLVEPWTSMGEKVNYNISHYAVVLEDLQRLNQKRKDSDNR